MRILKYWVLYAIFDLIFLENMKPVSKLFKNYWFKAMFQNKIWLKITNCIFNFTKCSCSLLFIISMVHVWIITPHLNVKSRYWAIICNECSTLGVMSTPPANVQALARWLARTLHQWSLLLADRANPYPVWNTGITGLSENVTLACYKFLLYFKHHNFLTMIHKGLNILLFSIKHILN